MAECRSNRRGLRPKWQETFEKLGRAAPAPHADESDLQYLRRISRIGRRYIPAGEEIAKVAFDSSMPDSAFRHSVSR